MPQWSRGSRVYHGGVLLGILSERQPDQRRLRSHARLTKWLHLPASRTDLKRSVVAVSKLIVPRMTLSAPVLQGGYEFTRNLPLTMIVLLVSMQQRKKRKSMNCRGLSVLVGILVVFSSALGGAEEKHAALKEA